MNWSCGLSDGDVPADMDMLTNFFGGDSLDCTLLDALAPDTGNGSAFRPLLLPTTKSHSPSPTAKHSSENAESLLAGDRPATRAFSRIPPKTCTLGTDHVTCIKVEPFATGPGASASGTDGDAALSSASWERGEAGSARQGLTDLEGKVEQTGRRARGGSAKRPRTSVQQQQNKLAQQRYREKRKQKVCELERRAAELEAQLEAVRAAQSLPECRLSDETTALRERVAEQQRTIDDLRRELRAVSTATEPRLTAHAGCERSADPGPSPIGTAPACMMVATPEEALTRILELTGYVRQALASRALQTGVVV